jgi:pimeloyl-ACP methyl ester carboxylesterase
MNRSARDILDQTLDRNLTRRAALAGLAGAGVAAIVSIADHAAGRDTPAPAMPIDEQLAWILAALNDGAQSLTAADVTAHFTDDFLTAVPPEQIVGFTQQIAAAFGPVILDGFSRPPTSTQVNALVTTSPGIPLVVPIAVEAAPPHRITGLNFSPVPPPSGVQLAPTVNLDGTPVVDPERRDGLVEVGDRGIYLTCRGTGSPTVVLESGANDPAAHWFAIESAVASITHVCTYDRANTTGGASDAAPEPRTGDEVVADLHALLAAAGESGPYVFVGHSIGGIFVRLYASTYSEEVAGLVLVDPSHEDQNARMRALLSPEQWMAYEQMNLSIEGLDLDASFAQVKDAQVTSPLRPMPLIVLTAGAPTDPATMPPGWPVEEQERLWHEQHEDLAGLVPEARHIIAEQSSHYIHQGQPDLVVEAIQAVVEAVRDPGSWATPEGGTPVS